MIYGLDCTSPPRADTARVMFTKGWRFLGCYVGGPRAAAGHHGWPNAAVGTLAQVGFVFLPIYVGRTHPWDEPGAFSYEQGLADGDDANVLTGACGFDSDTPLFLDAEAGDYQSEPSQFQEYVRGWVERVNGAGHKAGLYSDIETLNVFGPDAIDLKWGASWSRGPFSQVPPVGRFDPASPPPWDVWQYGGGTVAGVSVDFNSAVDDFAFAHYTPPA